MQRHKVGQLVRSMALFCTAIMVGSGVVARAQAINGAPPPPAQNNAPPVPAQQLDNLVGPIALYPDPLLGQILAASTYPVELVEAEQWLEANRNLSGQQLINAAHQQNWDASVQALVAMPQVLSLLTQDIHWTTDLGNAFLAQQGDVMAAVQRMRSSAQANGRLQSTPQETVTTQDQNGQSAIEIEPADPQTIYIPEYDPYLVWGWGNYPPLYYPDGYWFEPGIDVGLYFGGWGGWGYGGLGWGWGMNWFGSGLFVNNAFFNRYGYGYGRGFVGGLGGRTTWAHDPGHRLGAAYPGGRLTSRFGAASQASRVAEGRAGNWHTFSGTGAAGRNSFAGSAAQAGGRGMAARNSFAGGRESFQSGRGGAGYQSSGPRYSTPAQRNSGAAQRYQGSAQRYQTPAYRAPERSFQSAPRMSAPSFGGGGARSFGGGGVRSSGGGGHSSGGGHGGGRR